MGTGYVGLVTGACLASIGHEVTCYDVDVRKLDRLRAGDIPFYEAGLHDLVTASVSSGRLCFSHVMATAIWADTEAVFLALPTPQGADGRADLRIVDQVMAEILVHMGSKPRERDCVIVTKSTVSVGTTGRLAGLLRTAGLAGVVVANNPEFLREGSAVSDFMAPDRIVVGCDTDQARAQLQSVYQPFIDQCVPFMVVDFASSELIKYAANTFLAAKVAFINEMAVLSEAVGANIQEVSRGMGLDPRIGHSFLRPGPGYGGSCFPKDVAALAAIGRDYAVPLGLVSAVAASNHVHKTWVLNKITTVLTGPVGDDPERKKAVSAEPKPLLGKNITVLGLAFKANTDDIRDSVAVSIAMSLVEAGASVTVFDPEAMANARGILGDTVRYAADAETSLADADVGVVLTEWASFQMLPLATIRDRMRYPVIVDMRGLWDSSVMKTLGFSYFSIGIAMATLTKELSE
jgi:UDPglucose 6-dehydrogenase